MHSTPVPPPFFVQLEKFGGHVGSCCSVVTEYETNKITC